MRKLIKSIFAITLVFSLMAGIAVQAADFSDTSDHNAAEYISEFAENGYINGYGDGTFKPNNLITRAEFSTIISKFSQSAGIEYGGFEDVSGEEWYSIYIENAVSRGFIHGYDDNTFRPNNDISRFECIKIISMMIRFDGYASVQLPYSDAGAMPTWVSNHVRNLYGAGIIGAYADNKIDGNVAVTRAEAVTMLVKVLRKHAWAQESLTETTINNIRNPLPIPAEMPHDIIGYLTIPSISLKNNPCRDGATLENMKISIAHYAETSIWDGNVGLCAHNRDYTYDFRNLHKVNIGDEVIYRTRFGERRYKVTTKVEIADDDWGYLGKYSEVNKITMTTCVAGVANKRLCVQATEVQ